MQSWLRILIEPESGNASAWRMASLKSFFDVLLPSQRLLSVGLYTASSLALLFALLNAWSRGSYSRLSSAVSFGPSPASSLPVLWAFTSLVAGLVDPTWLTTT